MQGKQDGDPYTGPAASMRRGRSRGRPAWPGGRPGAALRLSGDGALSFEHVMALALLQPRLGQSLLVLTMDVDSTMCEVCSHHEGGAAYGCTQGLAAIRHWPLDPTREVLHVRMRAGRAARVAALSGSSTRRPGVRRAGASAQLRRGPVRVLVSEGAGRLQTPPDSVLDTARQTSTFCRRSSPLGRTPGPTSITLTTAAPMSPRPPMEADSCRDAVAEPAIATPSTASALARAHRAGSPPAPSGWYVPPSRTTRCAGQPPRTRRPRPADRPSR
jgi:hypothetical protein